MVAELATYPDELVATPKKIVANSEQVTEFLSPGGAEGAILSTVTQTTLLLAGYRIYKCARLQFAPVLYAFYFYEATGVSTGFTCLSNLPTNWRNVEH